MRDSRRLALWLTLVGAFIALQYAGRSSGVKPDNPLYHWSFAAESLVQEAIVLVIVLAVAGFDMQWFALRPPRSLRKAFALVGAAFVAINIFEVIYAAIVHPGNEQGLTPSHWEPAHAGAYILNGVIICTAVPFVEEMTFRGLGFGLLRRFVGVWPTIVAIGLLFGLSHGLVLELPVVAVFGAVLAWVRARTDSLYPGIVLHASFNAIALVVAVTI